MSIPRRPRLRMNRNPSIGMRNRQVGITKMAHTWSSLYGGDVLVVIRKDNGEWGGYQSDPSLIQNLSSFRFPESQILGPYDFAEESDRERAVAKLLPTIDSIHSQHTSLAPPTDLNPSQQNSEFTTSQENKPNGLQLPSTLLAYNKGARAPSSSPEILEPKPISARELCRREAMISLLEGCFNKI